mmetsp:Transcript_135244/g.432349  ORF Transcript_135244/g.432349 Transcript_135244/m.432349 type:complete len:259 (-) Transcript_135244:254-1030(-)
MASSWRTRGGSLSVAESACRSSSASRHASGAMAANLIAAAIGYSTESGVFDATSKAEKRSARTALDVKSAAAKTGRLAGSLAAQDAKVRQASSCVAIAVTGPAVSNTAWTRRNQGSGSGSESLKSSSPNQSSTNDGLCLKSPRMPSNSKFFTTSPTSSAKRTTSPPEVCWKCATVVWARGSEKILICAPTAQKSTKRTPFKVQASTVSTSQGTAPSWRKLEMADNTSPGLAPNLTTLPAAIGALRSQCGAKASDGGQR